MKKRIILFITFLMFIFMPKVYAAVDIKGGDGFWDDSFEICANPGLTDVIELEYDYQSSWTEEQKISKIQIDFSLPSGFSIVSTKTEYIHSGDSLTGSGSSYTLTVSEYDEFTAWTNNRIGFLLKITTVAEDKEYNLPITATVYNLNNQVIETKKVNLKYIVLTEEPSNNNCDDDDSISTFKVDGKEITGSGVIETDKANVDIFVTPTSPKAKIFYGDVDNDTTVEIKNNTFNANLDYGENEFVIFIDSECSAINEKRITMDEKCAANVSGYSFTSGTGGNIAVLSIMRNDNRSKVNTLSSLSISSVDIAFNPNTKLYTATVPYEVSSVRISSSLTDSKSSYVGSYGNRTVNLSEGNNDVLIKVKAENGAETTYTVKITREKNSDATLKTLKLNDKEIKLQKDLLKYDEYVGNEITTAKVEAIPNDSNAKVEIAKIEELVEGLNQIEITVTAANGKKNIYALNVIRDKLISENSKLLNITIKNHNLKFNPNTLDYTLEIDKKEDKLDISVETDHPKATYLIIGNKNLKNKSIIKIKVTAEDGKTVTNYNINIEKQTTNIILIIIIVILIIAIIGALILLGKQKNKKTYSKLEEVDKKVDDIPITEEKTGFPDSVPTLPTEEELNESNEENVPDTEEISLAEETSDNN